MSDTTTSPAQGPVEPTPMSFDQGVDAIAGLLDDAPEPDHVKAEMANTSEAKPKEPVMVEGEDELVLDDADLDVGAEAKQEAPPTTLTDDLEIDLGDGQKISLGELKRNNMFQRDYSRKTMELAELKKQQDQEYQKRVSDAENEIRQQRDFIMNYAQRFMPQPPPRELLETDPMGYWLEQHKYEDSVKEWQIIAQSKEREVMEAQQRQQEQMQHALAEEQAKLFEKMPKLKDETARKAFHSDAVDIGGKEYGITPDEIAQIGDHRYMRILHDAIQYRKAVAKAAAVKKDVVAKPKLVDQVRMAPGAVQDRDKQGRFSAHRQTGSIDSAAKAIEALL